MNQTEHAQAAMRIATILLASAIWSGCAPRCEPIQFDPTPMAKVVYVDPVQHATAALQQCFDAMDADIDADSLDVAFWGQTYSHVADASTVRFTSLLRGAFGQGDLGGVRNAPARHNACHEAEHVRQAQGRSRLGWWWHYLWNSARLEREADDMAVKYRDMVR